MRESEFGERIGVERSIVERNDGSSIVLADVKD
jgi:hypothetical protein